MDDFLDFTRLDSTLLDSYSSAVLTAKQSSKGSILIVQSAIYSTGKAERLDDKITRYVDWLRSLKFEKFEVRYSTELQ